MRTSPTAKLNDEIAVDVRRRKAAGESGKSIALDLGVHESTISRICNGKAYREQDAQSAEPQEAA